MKSAAVTEVFAIDLPLVLARCGRRKPPSNQANKATNQEVHQPQEEQHYQQAQEEYGTTWKSLDFMFAPARAAFPAGIQAGPRVARVLICLLAAVSQDPLSVTFGGWWGQATPQLSVFFESFNRVFTVTVRRWVKTNSWGGGFWGWEGRLQVGLF